MEEENKSILIAHKFERPSEVQKAGRLADNPKRQSLVGGRFERATLPFAGFQRAEPFGGYEVEKKSGESFLLGKLSFARAFRNGRDKGSRGYALAQ